MKQLLMIALAFVVIILFGYFLDILFNSSSLGLQVAVKAVENHTNDTVTIPQVPGIPSLWSIAVGVVGVGLLILAVVIIATAIRQKRGEAE